MSNKRTTYYQIFESNVVSFRSRKIYKDIDVVCFKTKEEALNSLNDSKTKVKSKIKYVISPKSITIFIDEPHIISRNHENYKLIKDAISRGSIEDVKRLISVKKTLENLGSEVKIEKNSLKINSEKVNDGMVDKFISMAKYGSTGKKAFKAFMSNLKKNPNKQVQSQLFEFLKHNDIYFTEDGCFLGYKYVRNDFKDVHTGKFDNSVGKTISMKRSDCDSDPNATCSRGLHVGAWDYVKSGEKILEVKVNPYHVVSVPHDYNGQKLRCCKYLVKRVVYNKRKSENLIVKA